MTAAAPPVPAQWTDEEIVARVRAGEARLFELLMRRYNTRLYRAVRSILRDEAETEMKQFAEQMVNDHTAGKNEVLALAAKLGVKPQASEVSKSLEEGHLQHAKNVQAQLGGKPGAK
jgi:hypothetical protein